MLAGSAHVPFDARHTPLVHSVSASQPRHALALPSQIGVLPLHIESVKHATHAPLVAQYGSPAIVQSLLLPQAATQTSFSQNGIVWSVQSVFVVHWGATQIWFTHNGIVESVQSAFVMHCGATHAPVELQTSVPSQGVMPDSP
jgi:hypothetical protein